MTAGIENNLKNVQDRIARAAAKAGRSAGEIQLVAVTKTVEVSKIKHLVKAGIETCGENKVQEMLDKMPLLPEDIHWHMIGRLQSNKVKYIAGRVSLIHSLDRWSLAREIQRRAEQNDVTVPVLVQVNPAGEESKTGLDTGEVHGFLKEISGLDRLEVKGLMTMAPFVDDPEEVRPVFREMNRLFQDLKVKFPGIPLEYLSMGMTNDFEVAIEEGANMVRIGSAIFGPRHY